MEKSMGIDFNEKKRSLKNVLAPGSYDIKIVVIMSIWWWCRPEKAFNWLFSFGVHLQQISTPFCQIYHTSLKIVTNTNLTDFNGVHKINRKLSLFSDFAKRNYISERQTNNSLRAKIYDFSRLSLSLQDFEGSSLSLHNFDENLHPWQRESSFGARRISVRNPMYALEINKQGKLRLKEPNLTQSKQYENSRTCAHVRFYFSRVRVRARAHH